MRAAIVENGVVVNIAMVQSLGDLPGAIDAQAARIDDRWDGLAFTSPAAPPVDVPSEVTMGDARRALILAGLMPAVQAAFSAMSGLEGELARSDWEYQQFVRRNSPLVAALQRVLGKTDSEIDALFVQAAQAKRL